ncbi:73064edf-a0e5-4ae9-aa0b-e050d4a978a9 [Sclerotinia trifoliorum]|uniref:73064edf-a0e5-4ae9-aa0b-e050d4a978a9 n=1 Tax=Sclerotinia trifoliorum TaxID=28548 RepID=A0A8H2VMR5_9HELO|nr:73064edf-a0e5-4ae9-aa0b-e050d4a978a9 [Sclerotinia trifoliorum]
MTSRFQKNICQCNNQPFSSALLLLSILFPKLSYAQISTVYVTPDPLPSYTPQNSNVSPQNPDTGSEVEDTSSHVYNYYFVIVAVFVVIVFFLLLYITRRRKRKAELLRNNGRSALARDVQAFTDFRTRFGPRRGGSGLMGMTMATMGGHSERQEGLDDRGEAPPAYVEGDKPPSLRSEDGITMMISNEDHCNADSAPSAPTAATPGNNSNTAGHDALGAGSRLSAELSRPTSTTPSNSVIRTSIGGTSTPITSTAESNQNVELRPLSQSTSPRPPLGPPTYSETFQAQPDLARPAAAVTAQDRFTPTRRLISESRTSSEM